MTALKFSVGTNWYTARVTREAIYGDTGRELWGQFDPERHELLLSPTCPRQRRASTLLHEYLHAALSHYPRPQCEEDQATLFAELGTDFHRQLADQGGADALADLEASDADEEAPAVTPSRARPLAAVPGEYRSCDVCSASIAHGAIIAGLPVQQGAKLAVERCAYCETCNSACVWWEVCDEAGRPLGTVLSHPRPKLLRGREATAWAAQHPEAVPGVRVI